MLFVRSGRGSLLLGRLRLLLCPRLLLALLLLTSGVTVLANEIAVIVAVGGREGDFVSAGFALHS
jgi:hypothetical protein